MENFQNLLITLLVFSLFIKKTLIALHNLQKRNKLIHYNIVEKKVYSYNEAYEASLEYFNGDELAARVWVNKYAVKDSFGNIYEKSPRDMALASCQ